MNDIQKKLRYDELKTIEIRKLSPKELEQLIKLIQDQIDKIKKDIKTQKQQGNDELQLRNKLGLKLKEISEIKRELAQREKQA